MKKIIQLLISFLLLVIVQVILFNHLSVYYFATPIVYLYPLLKLPISANRQLQIFLAAVLGFVVDLFMNTPGLNMACSALVMYWRTPLLLKLANTDEEEVMNAPPSFKTLSVFNYLLYLFVVVVLHIACIYLLEAFSVRLYVGVLPYIAGSSVFTLLLYVVFDAFMYKTS